MVTIFDSGSLIVHPSPRDFATGINPPSVFARTRDDQPSPLDSLEWYMRSEETGDPSDPAGWDDIDLKAEQAMFEDAMACGFYHA